MSANIFKIKIIDSETKIIDTGELIKHCFDIPKIDFSFGKFLKSLSIELEKGESSRNMKFQRFFELLQINHKQKGDLLFNPISTKYSNQFQNLKESYKVNKIENLIHPKILIWNNILANLNIEGFSVYPVHKLTLEIAQDLDGVLAFPRDNGLGIKSTMYREFMIRIIIDIQSEITESQRNVSKWFKENDGIMYPTYPNQMNFGKSNVDFSGDEGFIWGIEEGDKIIINVDNKEFWKDYPNFWWTNRMKSNIEYWIENVPNWIENNKKYPFTIAKFSILIHPSWFGVNSNQLLKSGAIFDSTAYAN